MFYFFLDLFTNGTEVIVEDIWYFFGLSIVPLGKVSSIGEYGEELFIDIILLMRFQEFLRFFKLFSKSLVK